MKSPRRAIAASTNPVRQSERKRILLLSPEIGRLVCRMRQELSIA
jgi:hypothetical protein